ncbi:MULTISPECIES: DEAD/DEAH box helicase [Clostridium]|uniref:DEAD/DEAH box helicase n=1 Tax=Clostridium faecium TaxID=2762223 RepID=A0ABR8YQ95_9CLOT|nr:MULTISPECIES: DEAD/DEAH box helicase [Clostridium]MBD8046413.1 DEAD/DEAH box helicase [Clostridium faecium]MDU1350375.1 DEAD/DEAH box helicase [Clostridium argentinense]
MNISIENIRKLTDVTTFSRGLNYYTQGKIFDFKIDSKYNYILNEEIKCVKANVESSIYYNSYAVEIEFIESTKKISCNCTCPAFDEYGHIKACKHIIAVLIHYSNETKKSYEKSKINSIDNLVEKYKNNFDINKDLSKELTMDIIYYPLNNYDKCNSIELKIGLNKKYVVKNMKNFLEAVYKNQSMEFGKNFTFNLNEQYFNDDHRKLIDLLLEVYELNKVIEFNNYSSTNFRILKGKRAYLTDIQTKRFLNIFKGKTINMVDGIDDIKEVKIEDDIISLNFNIKNEKDKIHLSCNSELYKLTKDRSVIYYEDKIHMLSNEQIKIWNPIFDEMEKYERNHLIFPKEQGENIANYIIPALKNSGAKLKIDQNMKNNFYEEKLNTKIYLDKVNENISAEVSFNYGDLSINPIENKLENHSNKILIRDLQKEKEVIDNIKNCGFTEDKKVFILKNQDKIINFILEKVYKLQDFGEIYYSDSVKNMKVYTASNYKASVRLNSDDLLEFSFDIDEVNKKELKDIFKSLKEKKKYHKLKNGDFVSLEEKELKNIANIIDFLDIKDSELDKSNIVLSKYNALYLDENLKQSNMEFLEKNKNFRELINNVKSAKEMDYTLPYNLKDIMRPYQVFGFKWLKTLATYGFGGILADEMGLGKTLQAIAFLASEKNGNPSLVVAPSSLVYNWKSEFEKFTPEIKVTVVSGSKSVREELIKDLNESDVVITSYPLIRRDIEEYKAFKFNYCILDEAQQIKNPLSINAASVKQIRANGYFALSGTPIENSLTELWSIFDFIMPGYLLSNSKFTKKYELPIVKHNDDNCLEALNKRIKPFILKRFKKDVIKELPPKIEHRLVVDMSEEQKKVYGAYLLQFKEEMEEEINNNGFNKSKIKIFSLLTRLRQICCDPSVFIEDYKGSSGKIEALESIIEEGIDGGHKILIFSQFTSVLKNIGKRLEKNKVNYMYLDGSTKVEDRLNMVNQFNEGNIPVFLISIKAGGTGLNLTSADLVIHFDPWWNPAVEDQATDRAHRIGQKNTVEVIKLIAKGTIEEKIFNLQEKKKEMINNVISDEFKDENIINKMTKEELEELFSL